MDEMTQHNAALVEEINAAIEQTESQAGELDEIVAVFATNGAAAAPSTSRAAAAQRRSAPVRKAAGHYVSHGNAAVAQDWNEF
jgi:methyl-accepting chemotaxis protein